MELVVALLGLLGTLLGGAGYVWKRRQEVQAIRQGFRSEIGSLAEVIRLRRYIEDLRECAREIDEGVHGEGASLGLEIPLDLSSYRPVWTHYANRVGSLPRGEAEKVCRFYQLVDGVARDVSPGGVLHSGTPNSEDFRDAADLLERALTIADEICDAKRS